jgi:hypothetical protein
MQQRVSDSYRIALCACLFASLLTGSPLRAGNEPVFPPMLRLTEDGESFRLALTGQARRVFLFFTVYEVAHYAELAGQPPLALDSVLADERAKALFITFSRKLGRDRIRAELSSSLRRNARPGWLEEAKPTIAAFMAAIDRDASAGDHLVFYWQPGGRLLVDFNGERAFTATDAAFARLIWSIWFGEDPACDREALLAQVPAGEAG